MKKLIVGQIIINTKNKGTGFLIDSDIVVTAKHNVLEHDDTLSEFGNEKEVVFRINNDEEIVGTTVNLVEAINKKIDCVFIKLYENATDESMYDLISANNSIENFNCKIIGFPKLMHEKNIIFGTISYKDDENNYFCKINEDNRLSDYEGLSGSPLLIRENIVGIVIEQESSEMIKMLPINHIKETLDCANIKIADRDIPKINNISLNIETFKDNYRQIVSIVGPRYSRSLNVKTEIYKFLKSLLEKNGVSELVNSVQKLISECSENLGEFIKEQSINVDSKEKANKIIVQWQTFFDYLDDTINIQPDKIQEIKISLSKQKEEMLSIFELEKNKFEDFYGKGSYNNKSWRGVMISYNLIHPWNYLDKLDSAIKKIPLIVEMLKTDLLSGTGRNAILITGKGGIGKTHLLCDIVHDFIEKGIPAILILGESFKTQESADKVLLNQYHVNGCIEDLFAILNEYGIQNNVYIPICIDAINEVNDKSYWNTNLPLLLAKLELFSNIKIIISCRTIYLEEYLENEKVEKYLRLQHDGFADMETEALRDFCEYYGVNINYNSVYTPEFVNPLFLKMLCEIAKDKEDKMIVVEDIQKLMDDFFKLKNKAITNEFPDQLSVKDNIVSKILNSVAKLMADNGKYYILWNELKVLVKNVLDEMDICGISSGIIKLLISENLLRESDENDSEITFAYQKFYEYYYSMTFLNKDENIIFDELMNNKITLGTLEMIQISYFNKTNEEFLSRLDEKANNEVVESFISGLYWRKPTEVNEKTITVVKNMMRSSNVNIRRRIIIGLLTVSLKDKFPLNVHFLHNILSEMEPYKRDIYFSSVILHQYDNEKVISDLCERAINLEKNSIFKLDNIVLWEIVLCWFTGSNDIKLRDKGSKGLINLFRLHPQTMIQIIELFKDIDDDYIHERIWQSVYSTIVILKKNEFYILISKYITTNIIKTGKWPQNVLIRDYLRNIFEFAFHKGWCDEKTILSVRPKYTSQIHEFNYEFIEKNKNVYKDLFWNCQESDFALYTIPYEVEEYGISKKDVGALIFEDMITSGYEICQKYDSNIDYKYGSLRIRDESIERIGKKYQKIYLYREMGNIFDNYPYSPMYGNDDLEAIPPEQGNYFREIDLTRIPRINNFKGPEFKYPYYRYQKSDDMKWFEKDDIEKYILDYIEYSYNNDEYFMLQGYLSDKEKKDKEYRDTWMQIRTYLYEKNMKAPLLSWLMNKNFDGRWMPEGYDQLTECCIGEYPWSPTMINYFSQDDYLNYRGRGGTPPPCNLITTVNDYITEKDSPFCNINDKNFYMFPAKVLFDKMKLSWDGSFGYNSGDKTVILNADNHTIFVKKDFFVDFLNQNNLDVVWTVLGGKQKLGGTLLGHNHPGSSTFSFSYSLEENNKLKLNHKLKEIIKPSKY